MTLRHGLQQNRDTIRDQPSRSLLGPSPPLEIGQLNLGLSRAGSPAVAVIDQPGDKLGNLINTSVL